MTKQRKPPLSWPDTQALSAIVNKRGAASVAVDLQISTTTLGRWCARIVGPDEFERDRLDVLLGKKHKTAREG